MNDGKLEESEIRIGGKKNYGFLLKFAIFVLVFSSLPKSVTCDMGDTIAFFILLGILGMFICAGIGWWNRRDENK